MPTRFFITIPSSVKVATGMLYPGIDKSGREFPFLIFSLFPSNYFDKFHFIPAALQKIITELDEILRKENGLSSLNNALKNYSVFLPHQESLQNKFNDYLSDTSVNEFLKRTKLNYNGLKITDMMYTELTCIRFSFYSSNEYFGLDAGALLSLLNKKIKLANRQSSIFWNQDDDGKFLVTIFPFSITAVNFIDLLAICDNNRILNPFAKVPSIQDNHIESSDSLKQLLKNF